MYFFNFFFESLEKQKHNSMLS